MKNNQKSLKIIFDHIKYDERYMPELFKTLPELQNKQNNKFLTILNICIIKWL